MQQNYVSLTTTKKLDEMEQIVRDVGMEILLKAENIYMKLEDLTKEEQISWLNCFEKEVKTKIEGFEERKKFFQDLEPTVRTYTDKIYEIMKKYRENPDIDIGSMITTLNRETDQLSTDYRRMYSFDTVGRVLPYFHMFYIAEGVYVSFLIARRGENVLRYVRIRETKDPVVTITGPRAEIIEAQMEAVSKLDACGTLPI